MHGIRALTAAAVLLLGGTANGQVGATLAGRIATSIPFGDAYRTSTGTPVPVAGDTTASIGFQLDAGVTIARHYFVGAYGSYRIGILKSSVCAEGLSCSDTGFRTGAEVIYSFGTSRSGAGAWVGLGTGWEWWTRKGLGTGGQDTVTLSGWEIAQLQLGADAWMSKLLRVGFYVAGSVAMYSQASTSGTEPVSIGDRTLHGWFEVGLKTTFDL
jgi:hypothetical protein